MVVSSATFISDSTLFLRDLLLTNVTDPKSGARPTGSVFVVTSYPERIVFYPLITIINDNFSAVNGGMNSEDMNVSMDFEVRVWARNVKERDTLAQNVVDVLRSKQTDASTGSIANNLFDFKVTSAVNVDEEGEAGIHSKVISVTYQLFIDT